MVFGKKIVFFSYEVMLCRAPGIHVKFWIMKVILYLAAKGYPESPKIKKILNIVVDTAKG